MRTPTGISANAPLVDRMSWASTPASIAVATARTQMMICDFSSSPRTSTKPASRQISFGRKPTKSSANTGPMSCSISFMI